MARDLSDLGIRVNSIMPGIFATPLMLGAKPQVLESLAASVPFPKRLGKPEEFASLAMELALQRPVHPVRRRNPHGAAIKRGGGTRGRFNSLAQKASVSLPTHSRHAKS